MNPPPKRRRCQKSDSAAGTNDCSGPGHHYSNSLRKSSHKQNGGSRNNRFRHSGRPRHAGKTTSRSSDTETASLTASSMSATEISQISLQWPHPASQYIPLSEEERMLPALLHWGKSERGMMKDQPPFRLRKILKLLGTNGSSRPHNSLGGSSGNSSREQGKAQISLIQSLSLRRHHLKLLNPTLSMPALRLGSGPDIRISADLFEQCIESHLTNSGIQFYNEKDQKKMHEQNGVGRQPLTPDFRMKSPLKLELTQDNYVRISAGTVGEQYTVHWIEAKMFYGASTIPHSTNNAVGTILPKAKQYAEFYGPGAIVFMYGCGEELARDLREIGVIALDCRGVDLERVVRHQLGWCGENGNVLF